MTWKKVLEGNRDSSLLSVKKDWSNFFCKNQVRLFVIIMSSLERV